MLMFALPSKGTCGQTLTGTLWGAHARTPERISKITLESIPGKKTYETISKIPRVALSSFCINFRRNFLSNYPQTLE